MKDKKKSHRASLKKKYAVEKKVKEHNRKVMKLAKKGNLHKQTKRKSPGIPNSFPFKGEMLQEIQRQKENKISERNRVKQEAREKRKRNNKELEEDEKMVEAPNLEDVTQYEAMRIKAESAALSFTDTTCADVNTSNSGKTNSTSSFYRSLREVIEKSDVIIEVLDARDPQMCRNLTIERQIVADGKKILLLLNKIDLVPKEVVELWIKYLRQSFPTIAFKSALKTSRTITHAKAPHQIISESELNVGSQVVGAQALVQLLKNYSRSSTTSAKTSIIVGIIGVPNVGKSSVINSLCRKSNAAKVGGEAGITRTLQEVQLDSKIKLIDSPGIIMDNTESDAQMILRNTVKISMINNPIEVVEFMVQQYPKDQLMKLFKIPFYGSTSDFLGHIARTRGKLCKGGSPDFVASAQFVITEWTSGKVRHFCLPPKDDQIGKDESEILSGPRFVSQFSEAFDINALLK